MTEGITPEDHLKAVQKLKKAGIALEDRHKGRDAFGRKYVRLKVSFTLTDRTGHKQVYDFTHTAIKTDSAKLNAEKSVVQMVEWLRHLAKTLSADEIERDMEGKVFALVIDPKRSKGAIGAMVWMPSDDGKKGHWRYVAQSHRFYEESPTGGMQPLKPGQKGHLLIFKTERPDPGNNGWAVMSLYYIANFFTYGQAETLIGYIRKRFDFVSTPAGRIEDTTDIFRKTLGKATSEQVEQIYETTAQGMLTEARLRSKEVEAVKNLDNPKGQLEDEYPLLEAKKNAWDFIQENKDKNALTILGRKLKKEKFTLEQKTLKIECDRMEQNVYLLAHKWALETWENLGNEANPTDEERRLLAVSAAHPTLIREQSAALDRLAKLRRQLFELEQEIAVSRRKPPTLRSAEDLQNLADLEGRQATLEGQIRWWEDLVHTRIIEANLLLMNTDDPIDPRRFRALGLLEEGDPIPLHQKKDVDKRIHDALSKGPYTETDLLRVLHTNPASDL